MSAPEPAVMVPVWQGVASLWQPEQKCFPGISTIKLLCVGFADGHVCASLHFLAGGTCPVLPSSSKSMGEAGK